MPQNNGGLTRAWSGQPRPCTSRMAAYCERGLPLKRKPLGVHIKAPMRIKSPFTTVMYAFGVMLKPLSRAAVFMATRRKPKHHGVVVLYDGPKENAALLEGRVVEGLDLLRAYAPRYSEYFAAGFRLIWLSGRRGISTQLHPSPRVLQMWPRWVFKKTSQELAIHFLAAAIRVRLARLRIRRAYDLANSRIGWIVVPHLIRFATKLPDSTQLVAHWEDKLRRRPVRESHGVGSQKVDA